MVVIGERLGAPGAVRHLEHVLPAVGVVLVRAEQPEIARFHVQLHDVAQKNPHDPRRLGGRGAGRRNVDGVLPEIRHPQIVQQDAAVGMRIGAHAPRAGRRKRGQFRREAAVLVEELVRLVALHPALEDAHVLGLLHVAHRHLVGAPVALDPLAVDLLRAGPAFRGAEHDHRPGRPMRDPVTARILLDLADFAEDGLERRRHQFVHRRGLVPLDDIRFVPVAAQELVELLGRDARKYGRIGDLVAVEMQDRQDGAVLRRIEEFVGVPARRQRSGFGFAVPDHGGDDEIGVVERGAIGMRKRIAEFAALMDRARRFRRDMARNAAREGELGEEPLQPVLVLRNVGVDLAVRPLEIGVRHQPRAAVAGPGDVDHVEIELFDHPVQMDVDEVQARRRAPVAEEARLDVFFFERDLEQRIVEEVDLPDRQIVRRTPVGVDQSAFLPGQDTRACAGLRTPGFSRRCHFDYSSGFSSPSS